MGLPGLAEKMIVPSGPHEPPRPAAAFVNVSTEPVTVSIRLSLPCAKKPTDRLFGDQKGYVAPSVPAIERAEAESSERNHNGDSASEPATKTIFRPSGEIAIETGSF